MKTKANPIIFILYALFCRFRFGWFIPRMSVVDDNPTVDHWRTFQSNPALAELFILDEEDYATATTILAWNPQTERFVSN